MLLFEGRSIKKQLHDRVLFDIDLIQVHDNQRIGLVGRNGTGKTSLLKIITGEKLPDEGKLTLFTSTKLVPQLKETSIGKSGGEITQQYLQNAFKDRKSTRLNSSHVAISYAVFCLKKKIKHTIHKRALKLILT